MRRTSVEALFLAVGYGYWITLMLVRGESSLLVAAVVERVIVMMIEGNERVMNPPSTFLELSITACTVA
jgi:hypothetical protein